MNWYYSGFPYSDELWHYNVKGSHWGERRYQNEDGSLTPLGRIHYGVGKARKAYNDAANRAWNSIVTSYKRKHPNMMTQEELETEISRQKKLNELKRMKDEYKKGSVREKASGVLWEGAKVGVSKLTENAATNIGKKIADRIFETDAGRKIRVIDETLKVMDKEFALEKKEAEFKERKDKEKQEKINEKNKKREEERQRKIEKNTQDAYNKWVKDLEKMQAKQSRGG